MGLRRNVPGGGKRVAGTGAQAAVDPQIAIMKQHRRTQTALVSHDPERLNRLLGLISRPSAHWQLFPAHARGSVAKDVHSGPSAWPVSGGEMGARIRAFDWERSPLGPISSWSHSLKGTANL